MKVIKEILFWTWCLPQTLVGLIGKWIFKGKLWHSTGIEKYLPDKIWVSKTMPSAVSLGKYIIARDGKGYLSDHTLKHEYGHQIQSFILGPLYLLIIALPSGLWCWFIHDLVNKIRIKKGKERLSYYWFYTEAWANKLVGLN